MQSRSDATPLIIAGMHRSGTSFVASLLHRAGVNLGDRLMPGGPGNERGHFENTEFVEFHERWLHLNGYDQAGWTVSGRLELSETGQAEALDLVGSNRRPGAWGWKDPRTSLFIDLWANLVPSARYVLLYREPAEVIDSLYRRGDERIVQDPELAARAWLCHNEVLLRFARAHRAQCILANIAVVARESRRFLAAVNSRFELGLKDETSSPFEAELMRTVDGNGLKAVLLRRLMPEIDQLFLELESEADFAAGVHRDGLVTMKRARHVFLGSWAASRRVPSIAHGESAIHDAMRLKAREQAIMTTEIASSLSKVREDLGQYKAALFDVWKSAEAREEQSEQ